MSKLVIDPLKNRVTSVMLLCILIACFILGRAIYLQLIRDIRIESLAKRQFQSKVLIRPRRGSILDRNSEPLAINIETQSLAANPLKINNKKSISHLLARITEVPHEKIFEKLREKKEFAWIKRHLTDYELSKLKRGRLMDASGNLINGLWLVRESKRIYPHGELASHVLGDVNVDSEGLEGIELLENEKLQGKAASVNAIKDALGRPTFFDITQADYLKEGESIILTIDSSLQFAAENELRKSVIRTGSSAGAAIIMNAVSGEILALANEPTFNPNDKNIASSKRRNRAITDGFEPGSILKPVILAGALSSGMKLTDLVWGEKGTFYIQGKQITEAEKHEQFEWLSLKKLIQVSSNIGAAKVALKLGQDKVFNTLKLFGFGSRTGVDFPGEIVGKIPARKTWQPLTLATIGFGQGVLVTPIQMMRAYAVFSNGGWLVKPKLIKNQVSSSSSEVAKRILSQKVVDSVNEALKSTTLENGTAVKAKLEGYEIAGKTGTAQVVDSETGKYSSSRYIASFVGYPLGVEPKVVIFVLLDSP
ncbi:MAG: penicillin-binding protein 2, partial [Deltaproteobacteria bacterium]|nr:penicillin-binding protein 2 [Deltaproteobacteria bacterium]